MNLSYFLIIFHHIIRKLVSISILAMALISLQAFAALTNTDSSEVIRYSQTPRTQQNISYTGNNQQSPNYSVSCGVNSVAIGTNQATFSSSFNYTYAYYTDNVTYLSGSELNAPYAYSPDVSGVYCAKINPNLNYRNAP